MEERRIKEKQNKFTDFYIGNWQKSKYTIKKQQIINACLRNQGAKSIRKT